MTVHGVKGGAGGILDLLKASKQVAGLDSALRYVLASSALSSLTFYTQHNPPGLKYSNCGLIFISSEISLGIV